MRPIHFACCGLALSACAAEPGAPSTDTDPLAHTEQELLFFGVTENPYAYSNDWPSAGHDWFHTGHNPRERTLGVDNVADMQVAWAFESLAERVGPDDPPLPTLIDEPAVIGTAVIADGIAYFSDQLGDVHARDLQSGAVVWSVHVSDAAPDPAYGARFQAGSVVTDGYLYVADTEAVVYKLDRDDGSVEWSRQVDDQSGAIVQGDLATIGPYVVLGVAGYENYVPDAPEDAQLRGSVVALRRSNGEIAWKRYTTSDQSLDNPKWGAGVGVWSSPAIDPIRSRVFIGTGQYYEPGSDTPDPASADDIDYSDSLLALDLWDGDIEASRQFTEGDIWGSRYPDGMDFDVGIPPTLFTIRDGWRFIDVVGVGDKKGNYYVMRRDNLELLWEVHVADGSVIGGFQATAAYADGVIYVAAHEAADGSSLQTQIPPGESATFLATPEGILLTQVGARTNLKALDAATGDVLWERPVLGGITLAPLVLANGVLYQGDMNGTVRAFDAATGGELFSHQIGGIPIAELGGLIGYGNIITSMSLSNGRLLVSSVPPLAGLSPTGLTAFGLPE